MSGIAAAQILLVEQGRDARLSTYSRLAAFYGCRVRAHVTFPMPLAGFRRTLYAFRLKERDDRDEKRRARNRERRRKRLAGRDTNPRAA